MFSFSGTIADNLRWGNPQATQEELVHACRLACADEFIKAFRTGMRPTLSRAAPMSPAAEAAAVHRPGPVEKPGFSF